MAQNFGHRGSNRVPLQIMLVVVVASILLMPMASARPSQKKNAARTLHLSVTTGSSRGGSGSSSADGGGDAALYSMDQLWSIIPTQIDELGRVNPKVRSFASCRYCAAPPPELTPGLGEGVVMCYFHSQALGNLSNFSVHTQAVEQCATQVQAMEVCEDDRDPDAPVDLFGNAATFVRGGRYVWKNPDGDDFHNLQGYMVHPPGGDKERLEFTLDLAIDGTNKCPRPFAERQIVEWVVFVSDQLEGYNVAGNYQVLDAGQFAVWKGGIVGRSQSATLNVPSFVGHRFLSVWMRASFAATDAHPGALSLIDRSSLAFHGECRLSCAHGGLLDEVACRCTCPYPWGGRGCGECTQRCSHGTLNPATCACEQCGNFVGPQCAECPIECGSTGRIDTDTCTCSCIGNFQKDADGMCTVCPLDCKNGGQMDMSTCTCNCVADGGFIGVECDVCGRTCVNGDLDEATCSCDCHADHWEGDLCHICNRQCHRRGTDTYQDSKTCECHNCPVPWDSRYGTWCHVCNRHSCGQFGHIVNATLADGSTTHVGGRTQNAIDQTKLKCYSDDVEDCGCCCDPVLDSPQDTCGTKLNEPDADYWQTIRWAIDPSATDAAGSVCNHLPDFCPKGHRSDDTALTYPARRCNCLYNWKGPLCDCCYVQCGTGGTLDEKCQCTCDANWRHSAGSTTLEGQCNNFVPQIKSGPTNEPRMRVEGNVAIYAKCDDSPDMHFCRPDELSSAFGAQGGGEALGSWHHFQWHKRLASVGTIKCLDFHLASCQDKGKCLTHSEGGSWDGRYLHIYEKTGTKHIHRRITHTSGTRTNTRVCLPILTGQEFKVKACGAPFKRQYSELPEADRNSWTKLVSFQGRETLNYRYWIYKCSEVPSTATAIRIEMGGEVDYIRPRDGHSWCDALAHQGYFQWSADMYNWKTPVYYGHHQGGSEAWWPRDSSGVPGEIRAFLSFWGSNEGNRMIAGCCANNVMDTPRSWYQSFTMWYTERSTSSATEHTSIAKSTAYWDGSRPGGCSNPKWTNYDVAYNYGSPYPHSNRGHLSNLKRGRTSPNLCLNWNGWPDVLFHWYSDTNPYAWSEKGTNVYLDFTLEDRTKVTYFNIYGQHEYSDSRREVAQIRIEYKYEGSWHHATICATQPSFGSCPNYPTKCDVPDSIPPAKKWRLRMHEYHGWDNYWGLMAVDVWGCGSPRWAVSRENAAEPRAFADQETAFEKNGGYGADDGASDPEVNWQTLYRSCSEGGDQDVNFANGYDCPEGDPSCPYANVFMHPTSESMQSEVSGLDTSQFALPRTHPDHLANHGALCCANTNSGVQACSDGTCGDCTACSGGYVEGCIGREPGTCKTCSQANCASKGLTKNRACGGGDDGCSDP